MAVVKQSTLIRDWNNHHPVGTIVQYWKGLRQGPPTGQAPTASAAQEMGGTAVVWLDGVSGCIALTHVNPVAAAEGA